MPASVGQTRGTTALRRELGRWDLTAIGVNQVIGAAVFVQPALYAANVGAWSPWLVAAVGVASLLIALSFAEVSSRFDGTGGAYLYTRAAFGRFAAFEVGWMLWFTRAASWAGLPAAGFVQTLIAEYRMGTPLGWHRDVPDYEVIVGVSLAGRARMRLRPYPWSPERKREIIAVELEPRSAYILRGPARWAWQHQVPPTKVLRYSITFRSARGKHG